MTADATRAASRALREQNRRLAQVELAAAAALADLERGASVEALRERLTHIHDLAVERGGALVEGEP